MTLTAVQDPPSQRLGAVRSAHRRRELATVRVLEHLEGSVAGLSAGEAKQAVARCRARKLVLPTGAWTAPSDASRCRGWMGLLVVEGLLSRTVEIDGLRAQELLGPGDVLRPWEDCGAAGSIGAATSWTVLDRAAVALLDEPFAAAAAPWPAVATSLVSAAVRRSQTRAILHAVIRARQAETRLMMLFWHLADRWGRVCPDGVIVPLALTHARVAELVCLRRPTVSMALTKLRDAGRLQRRDDGTWRLGQADPPSVADQHRRAA